MVIGTKLLLQLIRKNHLIDDLSDRELTNPESCVIDIRIGEISKLIGKGFLGIQERITPEHRVLAKYAGRPGTIVKIKPGDYFATESVETFHLPPNLFGLVKPRSTLFRSGIVIRAGVIDPGYSGKIHPGIFNASQIDFEIEMGARYVQVFFLEIKGGLVRPYQGQWQGGRKHVLIKETQT